MKVILCTPYIQSDQYVQGGVVVWGANIVNYYNSLKLKDVELIPISFDRKTYSESHHSKLRAYMNGIRELLIPVSSAINLMRTGDVEAIHISTSLGRSVLKDGLLIKAAKYYGVRSYLHFHCGRIPIVLRNNNYEHKKFLQNMKHTTKGITMDLSSYNALKDFGINNVVNLPNPLSLSIIQMVTDKKTHIKKVPGRIAFVGHVLKSKGVFELIESCCKIGSPDLHIIGKILPSDKQEIDELLSKKNTDGNWISWLGEIPHNKVIEELLEAEIFAFPSYSEGFPNVILEAMVCGCAIVSTTVGAIPEMLDITGEACGICVEPQNVNAFYDALQTVYWNRTLIKSYSTAAETRVKNNYAINIIWSQMTQIWES